MPRVAKQKKAAADLAARYAIAEWFGNDMTALTPDDRQRLGQLAAAQDETGSLVGAPICPFLASLIPEATCNKSGGVCSMRKFAPDGTPMKDAPVVTMCPSRFLQPVAPGESLFAWIAEKMLDTRVAIVVKETPFLRKISDASHATEAAVSGSNRADDKKAGRIDWILVNPGTVAKGELEWCAVETQSLYFSGKGMRAEFDAYSRAPSPVLFPVYSRRPDYRSSGPKRLWPQLDVKVPVLRNWGKKVVVVVDRFFYNNMNTLADPSPRAKSDRERRENADVAWFVVDFDSNLRLTKGEVVFTSLDSSRTALNATEPLSKADFTFNLRAVMGDARRRNKVFKASE